MASGAGFTRGVNFVTDLRGAIYLCGLCSFFGNVTLTTTTHWWESMISL